MKWLGILIVVAVAMFILIPIVRRMLNQRLEQLPETTAKPAELPLANTAQTNTANVAVQEAPKSQPQVSATPVKATQEQIPEDASLRRHYLSTRQAERLAITHPYPTDATLRRHHDGYLKSLLNVETLVESLPESSVSPQAESIAVVVAAEDPITPILEPQIPQIPEDSMLKRHFLTEMAAKAKNNAV